LVEEYFFTRALDDVLHTYRPQLLLMALTHCAPDTSDCCTLSGHVTILRWQGCASSIV